ncbi:MAG: heme exporter protein CcmD [Burkholderiaceae bacterium]|jgi:heme exporter protein D|nr:heme exporter protein CcmD [Burkholderiaceae bacterium]HMN64154.1 heme exporter protein CcmD [Burkholderiaceae bacterium]
MIEWLAMGGYGFYVWSSYGMLAIALVVELVWLRRHRRESLRRVAEMRAERSMAGASRPGEANR